MKRVSMTDCQKQLALVWYILAAPAIVLLIVQSQNNVYSGKDAELWGWILPNVMPTLLLITGTVVVDQINTALKLAQPRSVPNFSRNVAIALSVFYLLILNYVVFHSRSTGYSLATMQRSNIFLGPIQGLTGAALAVFFGTSDVSKTADPKPGAGGPSAANAPK